MILKVGLTGGIASGKSTVARNLANLGCFVIDADAVVAHLYCPGSAGHDAIVRTYGSDVLAPNGEIDRQKLADRAFADESSARQLNALIHPLVLAEEARMTNEELARFPDRDRIVVVEATLLLEAGGRERYDVIVVVDVDPELQLQRGVARGMSRDEVARRIRHQMSREERLRHADLVVENGGDLRAVEVATMRLYDELRARLARKKNGQP